MKLLAMFDLIFLGILKKMLFKAASEGGPCESYQFYMDSFSNSCKHYNCKHWYSCKQLINMMSYSYYALYAVIQTCKLTMAHTRNWLN